MLKYLVKHKHMDKFKDVAEKVPHCGKKLLLALMRLSMEPLQDGQHYHKVLVIKSKIYQMNYAGKITN